MVLDGYNWSVTLYSLEVSGSLMCSGMMKRDST